jgi:glycosyltransferase involved in cell wall biosynthesis
MPVHNEERYIALAIESLLSQEYKNFELIISDNASTDKTREICQEYASKDERIRYYRSEKDMGSAWNFNRVFKLSSGEYFMWAGGHDLWDKTYIRRCTNALKDPSVVLCYTQTIKIDQEGRELGIDEDRLDTSSISKPSQRFHKTMWELYRCNIIHGVIRSSALRKTRLFLPVIGSDHLLLGELSLLGKFVQLPIPLFYRREVNESREQKLERRLKVIAPSINHLPYSHLMFQHFLAVRNAHISYYEKVRLLFDVFLCFLYRYRVHKELCKALLKRFLQ